MDGEVRRPSRLDTLVSFLPVRWCPCEKGSSHNNKNLVAEVPTGTLSTLTWSPLTSAWKLALP